MKPVITMGVALLLCTPAHAENPRENLKSIFPGAAAPLIVPDDIALWRADSEALERARRCEELGLDFVIWNNRACAPLSYLEYCFQNFKHCIGTAEGEHFWSYGWEKGPEGNIAEWDYVRRAYVLCGKYGAPRNARCASNAGCA